MDGAAGTLGSIGHLGAHGLSGRGLSLSVYVTSPRHAPTQGCPWGPRAPPACFPPRLRGGSASRPSGSSSLVTVVPTDVSWGHSGQVSGGAPSAVCAQATSPTSAWRWVGPGAPMVGAGALGRRLSPWGLACPPAHSTSPHLDPGLGRGQGHITPSSPTGLAVIYTRNLCP